MKVRFTPRFGKRHSHLVDGEAAIEGMNGKVKLTIEHEGRVFWAFFDPIELAGVALGQVPFGRVQEVPHLEAFKALVEE